MEDHPVERCNWKYSLAPAVSSKQRCVQRCSEPQLDSASPALPFLCSEHTAESGQSLRTAGLGTLRSGFGKAFSQADRIKPSHPTEEKPDSHQHRKQSGMKAPRRSAFCFQEAISGERSRAFIDKDCLI